MDFCCLLGRVQPLTQNLSWIEQKPNKHEDCVTTCESSHARTTPASNLQLHSASFCFPHAGSLTVVNFVLLGFDFVPLKFNFVQRLYECFLADGHLVECEFSQLSDTLQYQAGGGTAATPASVCALLRTI
jgi:hypothetical protein